MGAGTVAVNGSGNSANVAAGTPVALTATPDEGYEQDTLTVTDRNGNKVTLTDEGDGKYTFAMPSSKVTVQAVFTEIETLPEPLPFADVAETAWYADAVRYVYENRLINGISDAAFDPGAPITREQFAAILYRYAQSKGLGFTGAWAFPLDYADADAVSEYDYEALCWMTMHGVIEGSGDKLNPQDSATRAEAAAMLMRYCGQFMIE